MVVGTPRSGTTLLQRTLSDSTGIATVPETHLFTVFAPRLLRTTHFPLDGAELRSVLERYVALKQHRGGAPDPNVLWERLDGRAGSLVEVFEAIVAELACGATQIIEKTPDHLLWVSYLAPALPTTRFVAIVRDPRAVYNSTAQVHWGQRDPVRAAERWRLDQRLIQRTLDQLGDRMLFVRYEDLVSDPDATAAKVKAFALDWPEQPPTVPTESAGSTVGASPPRSTVYRAHEAEWKGRVDGEVSTERISAWRSDLESETVAAVEAVCGSAMRDFGYETGAAPARRLTPREHLVRFDYRLRRLAHERRIRHTYAPRAGLGREMR